MVTDPRLGRARYIPVLVVLTLLAGFSISTRQTAVALQTWSLPAPWSAQDIGNPAIAGNASFNQSTFSIHAGGADIGNRSDEFTFIYQQVAGDVDIAARVDSITAASPSSETGVMIRSSLAANATFSYAGVTASRGVFSERRSTDGGQSRTTSGPASDAPYWVRLVKKGSTVTAYSSSDGTTWSTIDTQTIAFGASVYVGIATTSANTSAATDAAVSQVSLAGLSLPVGQQAGDIGSPSIQGSTNYSQGIYRIHAGGNDIWGTSDQFHFVYQQLSGDAEVIAHVQSLTNSDPWAKAGVMIRETLAADSRHAFAAVTAGQGYAFQRRIDPGGISTHTAGPSGAAPGWVRLVRTASRFDAYQSTNGTTWTLVGTDTIPMADAVYVGIATTSHSTTTATDAVADNFKVTTGGSAGNKPPTVAITVPADGTTVTAGNNIVVNAAANDSDGTIARVDFFAGTAKIGSSTTAPYSATWSGAAAGTYPLTAVAVDNDGASTTSASVSIKVDPAAANQPPTVTLTAPANSATFTAPASVSLAATASDTDGTIAKVEFYNGSTLLNTDTAAPYAFTWSSVAAGTYALKAVAYDDKGASTSSAIATIAVTAITNKAPTVSLTAPTNGAAYTEPATITLTATASDSDGTIAKVEFYNGTALLNTDTTSPYSYTWATVVAGTYSVTAKAYDNAGASASTASTTVTVNGLNGTNGGTPSGNGLLGAYSLNEGSGSTVNDSSGSGPSGTITNATWTQGKYGKALSFAGNGQVNFGDVDLSGAFTVMGWLQTRSLYTGTCGSFVMKAHDYGFEICGGQLYGEIGSNNVWTGRVTKTLTTADLNVWRHLALTYDGTTLRMYVDGVLINTATSAHTTTSNPLLFGQWIPAGEYLDGMVDEVRLYTRVLTAAEIQSDMNTAIGGGSGNQPPTVTLAAPSNGTTFTAPATVTLSATAADTGGTISKVEFYNGSTLLNTDTTSPYTFSWTNVAAGTYNVKAIAYDNTGASTSSSTATITVNGAANQAPTVTLTAPTTGSTFTAPATVTLSATASDTDGTISKVEFYNGGTLLGTDTTAPYSFSWLSVAAGTYSLTAKAYDNSGASKSSTTSTITVNGVVSTPPTGVAFTASPDHATLVTSYELRIYAPGADPNTATPIAKSNLGKPTPDGTNTITVDQSSFFSGLTVGNYLAAVAAIGSGGTSISTGVTFTR